MVCIIVCCSIKGRKRIPKNILIFYFILQMVLLDLWQKQYLRLVNSYFMYRSGNNKIVKMFI